MIPVNVQEDVVQDGFGAVLVEGGDPVVIAVMHDGTFDGAQQAERIGNRLRIWIQREYAAAASQQPKD